MIISSVPIKREEVERDRHMIVGIMEYFRWLAEQDPTLMVSVKQVAGLYQEHVRVGRFVGEVLEELGLPAYPEW